MRRPAFLATPLVAAVLLLAACGSDDGGSGSGGESASTAPPKTPSTTAIAPTATERAPRSTATAPPRCVKVSEPAPRAETAAKPTRTLDPAKSYRAEVETSCGTFTIALAVKQAPRTTASFASLARGRFYDGLTINRISPGFVIQGGDPRGDGNGGPGYSITEAPPEKIRYTRGTVAMAKAAEERPGTSGSQFFVVTAPDASATPFSLAPDYALVGRVASGLNVVRLIADQRSDSQSEKPLSPIVIRRVRIRAG